MSPDKLFLDRTPVLVLENYGKSTVSMGQKVKHHPEAFLVFSCVLCAYRTSIIPLLPHFTSLLPHFVQISMCRKGSVLPGRNRITLLYNWWRCRLHTAQIKTNSLMQSTSSEYLICNLLFMHRVHESHVQEHIYCQPLRTCFLWEITHGDNNKMCGSCS